MKENERNLIQAFDTLETRLSESDLQTLCFRLGIDYDDLPEKGRINKLRNLLIYLERRNRISDLVNEGQKSRPDIPWSVLFRKVNERSTETDCLPVYPYEHFSDSFRDVIAPLPLQATGSVLNIVFGDISKVEQTTLVIPVNQSFDFWQRGRGSVLGSLERITVDNQPFFDSIERIWPLNKRPKYAGIGHSHFVRLPRNPHMLSKPQKII